MFQQIIGLAAALAILPLPALAGTYVLDGDTVIVDGEHIRIANIDTPEIGRARCDAELAAGLKAKARTRDLVASGRITIERGDNGRMYDRYRRTLGRVYVDGRDIGEILIAEGLARRWDGRRRPWCR